jgi:hypothetical protein
LRALLLLLLLLLLQAAAQHRQAVKDRKKQNQEKSAVVQKVRQPQQHHVHCMLPAASYQAFRHWHKCAAWLVLCMPHQLHTVTHQHQTVHAGVMLPALGQGHLQPQLLLQLCTHV